MHKRIICLVTLVLMFPVFAAAGTIQLPRTGQTSCYDTAGTEISCAGTGQDGDLRAGAAWPNPRFSASGDCVTDNLTGLVWAKDANLPGGTRTWQEALDFANGLDLCGQTDWRLPNRKELQSLVDRARSNLALPDGHPFINVQSYYYYWSSSTYAGSTDYAWIVYMGSGYVYYDFKYYNSYVWPVRGGD